MQTPRQLSYVFGHSSGLRYRRKGTRTQRRTYKFPTLLSTLSQRYHCGRKVVLGMTRSQVKRIDWEPLRTSPNAHLVDAVISHKSTKFFLVFPEPWWRHPELQYLNLIKGRSISSLEIRQTFYFAPESNSGRSFIMAYNDASNAEFWGSLADRNTLSRFPGSVDFLYQLNNALVDEAVKQMAINHNTTEDVIGRPEQGVVMFWDHDATPGYFPNYGPNMPSNTNWYAA